MGTRVFLFLLGLRLSYLELHAEENLSMHRMNVENVPTGAVFADINFDGVEDIVVTSFINGSLSYSLGNKDGTRSGLLPLLIGPNYEIIQIPDAFNLAKIRSADGPDHLVVTSTRDQKVYFLKNISSPQNGILFNIHHSVQLSARPRYIKVVDLDGDNFKEVLVGTTEGLDIIWGDSYMRQNIPLSAEVRGIDVCDFNGDGSIDIWLANHSAHRIVLLSQIMPRQFSIQSGNFISYLFPIDIQCRDLNNDFVPEVSVLTQHYFGLSSHLFIIEQTPNGLDLRTDFPTLSTSSSSIDIGDWDRDGDLDFLIGDDSEFFRIHKQVGEVSYEASLPIQTGQYPEYVMIIQSYRAWFYDWNGDGQLDIWTINPELAPILSGASISFIEDSNILQPGHRPTQSLLSQDPPVLNSKR